MKNNNLLIIRGYFLLLAIRLGLLVLGFNRVHQIICSRPLRASSVAVIDVDKRIEQICNAVRTASRYQFVQMRCLERSYALFYLFKQEGIGVDFCIGVSRFPFASHCWIEYQGVGLDNPPELLKDFKPILIVPSTYNKHGLKAN